MYQNNKLIILVATNGRFSSSKQSKYINHRYFFVKDKYNRGKLEIEYKLTGRTWYDFDALTKPKQSKPFYEICTELTGFRVSPC